jgi:hypothetical protein
VKEMTTKRDTLKNKLTNEKRKKKKQRKKKKKRKKRYYVITIISTNCAAQYPLGGALEKHNMHECIMVATLR